MKTMCYLWAFAYLATPTRADEQEDLNFLLGKSSDRCDWEWNPAKRPRGRYLTLIFYVPGKKHPKGASFTGKLIADIGDRNLGATFKYRIEAKGMEKFLVATFSKGTDKTEQVRIPFQIKGDKLVMTGGKINWPELGTVEFKGEWKRAKED